MLRASTILFCLAFLSALLLPPKSQSAPGTQITLDLELPASAPPPSYAKDRVSKLEIDGRDYSTPRSTRRSLKLALKEKTDSIRVVYTFWPTIYQRIIRTKVVKVGKGGLVKASLMRADTDTPDKIWVIYVTTPDKVVEAMCRLAKISKNDVVYDIGCGDGRMVIRAVREYEAKKGVGIDLLPERISESRENAKKAGIDDKITFLQKDALTIKDFSAASVVMLYLGNTLNEALRPALQKTLKPGARIVSHRFLMGNWKPDKTETIRAKDNKGVLKDFQIHLWTIK